MNLLTQHPGERWQPLVDYPGHHISDHGRIYSDRLQRLKPLHSNKDGYIQVTLYTDQKSRTLLVHILVAQYFVPNVYHDPEVNHQDLNKANNHFSNLEWCTHKQNIEHAIAMGAIRTTKPRVAEVFEPEDTWMAR